MKILSLIFAILLAVALAAPAFAQPQGTAQGSDSWSEISNYKGWPVSELVVTGLDKGKSKQIREGLRLANDGLLYEKHLKDDINRIRLFLAQRGYPFAQVTPLITPDRAARKLELTLEVDRGPAVTAVKYDVVNVPEQYIPEIESSLRLSAGDVFTDADLEVDIATVVEELKKLGYERARAAAKFAWIDTTRVAVRIVAKPGPVCYFREVTVEGVTEDLANLAYTYVDIDRGDRYELRTENEAREYLGRTGLFRQIRFNLEDVDPDSLDVVIDLQQRKPRSIETAFGFWTDNRFTGRVRWQHRNIFRQGRGVSVELLYNYYRQWGEFAAWWPALFGMKKSIGNFRLGLNNANEPGYDMLAPTTSVAYGYNFTRRFSGTITAALSNPSYENKTDVPYDFPDNPGYVGWFETRLTRDGTNDRVAPTKGSFTWLRFEWGPAGGVSEINWIRVEVNGSYMFPVKATGVAVNARVGWGKPIAPATMLLPDRRFYAGGSMANRGFHRHRLGPKDSQGLPVGGEVLALGFVEYRFPIAWKFQGAAFVDLGQVWQTNDDVTIRNVEVSVGPALRVLTPVGPLRLDWGFRLTNYDTTEPSSAFHFAIGYPM